jgi:hypothetical protein
MVSFAASAGRRRRPPRPIRPPARRRDRAATRLFTLAESLGGVESLIEVLDDDPRLGRRLTEVPDALIRLSCGIEAVDSSPTATPSTGLTAAGRAAARGASPDCSAPPEYAATTLAVPPLIHEELGLICALRTETTSAGSSASVRDELASMPEVRGCQPTGAKFCGECGTTLTADAGGVGMTTPGAQPSTAAPIAERRVVSVLFADLVGFTAASEGTDPEETRDLLSRYFELARDVIGRYGGTVEKFIGVAVMAVWGAPTAHEDDAERAVRAGLELVDAIHGLGPGMEARAGVPARPPWP